MICFHNNKIEYKPNPMRRINNTAKNECLRENELPKLLFSSSFQMKGISFYIVAHTTS